MKTILHYTGWLCGLIGFLLLLGLAGRSDTGAIKSMSVIIRWAAFDVALMLGGAGLVWLTVR